MKYLVDSLSSFVISHYISQCMTSDSEKSVTVHGKTEAKISNVSVSHVYIVGDIVDEVIIRVDFMIANGISFNMGQQIMSWRNVEIPLDVGYTHQVHTRRIVAVEQQKLPPQSESLICVRIKRRL